MTVARVRVEELLVQQRHDRSVTVAFERQCHQRFALGRGLPGPGENKFLVRDDLPVNPADIVVLAARSSHDPAVAATGAQIAFRA